MSDQIHERFEVPKEVRSVAEASLAQARKTFEKFLEGAQATKERVRTCAQGTASAWRSGWS